MEYIYFIFQIRFYLQQHEHSLFGVGQVLPIHPRLAFFFIIQILQFMANFKS